MAIHLIDFKENNGGRTKSPVMFLQALFISAVKVVVHSPHISPEGSGVGGERKHNPNRLAVHNSSLLSSSFALSVQEIAFNCHYLRHVISVRVLAKP